MQRASNMRSVQARMTPARLVLLLGAPTALALASWVYLSVMINDMSMMPGMSAIMMRVFSPMQFIGLS
jgi:hypothetical protein